MCLEIKSGPYVAKKDFYTLKMVEDATNKKCNSFFENASQHYNKILKAKITPKNNLIEEGLHSFYKVSKHIWQWRFCYGRAVVLCKIPKGSEYYIGQNSDLVSNQLIIIEPIVHADYLLEERVSITDMEKGMKMAFKICKSYNLNMNPS